MTFLPFENIQYNSDLGKEEIINRLKNIIESEQTFRLLIKPKKKYEGGIYKETFYMMKIIQFGNNIKPIFYGCINSNSKKTQIIIKIRLSILIYVLIAVFTCALLFLLIILIHASILKNELQILTLLPLGFLLIFYLYIMFNYRENSYEIFQDLEKIFETIPEKIQ